MRRLLLGFALVLAAPAWAQPAVEESLVIATSWMAQGEFERALTGLNTALVRAKEPGSVARLQLARGQCLLALSRRDKALAAFKAALRHDVSIELPADAGPDTVDLFEKARASFPGTVVITVDGDATVRIDGRDRGPAPLTLRLPPDSYAIEATTTDGRSAHRTLQVKAGDSLNVELVLTDPLREAPPPPPPVVEAPKAEPPPPPLAVEVPPRATTDHTLSVTPRPPAPNPALWIPVGVGAAAVAAGALSLGLARGQYTRLVDSTAPPLSADEEQRAVRGGTTLQTMGWIGVGVGAAAVATGVVLLVLPPKKAREARVQVSVSGEGGWVGLCGELP